MISVESSKFPQPQKTLLPPATLCWPKREPTFENHILVFRIDDKMGAYKYLEELWRKKQSDVLRFLLRVR
jgi:hypothetical protein